MHENCLGMDPLYYGNIETILINAEFEKIKNALFNSEFYMTIEK